jgi:hypothetical protein
VKEALGSGCRELVAQLRNASRSRKNTGTVPNI